MVYTMKIKLSLLGHNSWFGFTVSKPINIKVRIKLALSGRSFRRPTKTCSHFRYSSAYSRSDTKHSLLPKGSSPSCTPTYSWPFCKTAFHSMMWWSPFLRRKQYSDDFDTFLPLFSTAISESAKSRRKDIPSSSSSPPPPPSPEVPASSKRTSGKPVHPLSQLKFTIYCWLQGCLANFPG